MPYITFSFNQSLYAFIVIDLWYFHCNGSTSTLIKEFCMHDHEHGDVEFSDHHTIFLMHFSFSLLFLNYYFVILFLVGLSNLEKINLSFTFVNDSGLSKLCGLSSLKSLNLDARQVTDTGLASLTSMCSVFLCKFTVRTMVCLLHRLLHVLLISGLEYYH